MLAQITDSRYKSAGRNGAVTPPDPDQARERTANMAEPFPISDACNGKGAQGELIASAWLIGLGYEVFRNLSPTGPADIVAWDHQTGEVLFIDVKTVLARVVYSRPDGSLGFPIGKDKHPGVHKIIVVGGRVIGFFRQTDRYPERHWPLSRPEVSIAFEAPTYKETVAQRPSHARRGARQ